MPCRTCTSLRMDTNHYQVRALIYTYLLLLRTGTHTYGMDEPITCASELEELALALELELEPLVALQLVEVLEMIRSSGSAGDFVSTWADVVRRVTDKRWWVFTVAIGQGGFIWGGDLRDSILTHEARR